MTDFLEVKAKRTFAVGAGVKTRKSEPFTVEAGEARQLEALGYVEIVGEVAVAPVDGVEQVGEVEQEENTSETETETETETPVTETEPEPAGRKPRKAKADAVDENS